MSKLEETIRTRERSEFFLANIAENSAQLFVLLDTVVVMQHLLLVRLLRGQGIAPSILPSYKEDFTSIRRELNRFMQTLLIYSARKDWRQSAFKQLSEDLGDADTLRAFTELRNYKCQFPEDLKRATEDLAVRLNESVRQAALSRLNQ